MSSIWLYNVRFSYFASYAIIKKYKILAQWLLTAYDIRSWLKVSLIELSGMHCGHWKPLWENCGDHLKSVIFLSALKPLCFHRVTEWRTWWVWRAVSPAVISCFYPRTGLTGCPTPGHQSLLLSAQLQESLIWRWVGEVWCVFLKQKWTVPLKQLSVACWEGDKLNLSEGTVVHLLNNVHFYRWKRKERGCGGGNGCVNDWTG